MALDKVEAGRCKGCGGDLVETTDPDNEDRYTADLFTCHRCAVTQRAVAQFGKGEDSPGSEGVYGYAVLDSDDTTTVA